MILKQKEMLIYKRLYLHVFPKIYINAASPLYKVMSMLLGRICGKVTTTECMFLVDANPQKFDYVQVFHKGYDFVLCQIVEIERTEQETKAKCIILGYLDNGIVKQIRTPFEPGMEVLPAEDEFIRSIIRLDDDKNGAYLGFLEGKKIPVYLNLNKLLTKHLAILAKSGAGKSYSVGVLLEEIMEKKVPLLIIDPHGEHSEMKRPNDKDHDAMIGFGIQKKGYADQIVEYGDPALKPDLKPLKLPENISASELLHILPSKLSAAQQNVLYSAIKQLDTITLPGLIRALELDENNARFSVINIIDHLQSMGIFSISPTPYNEVIRSGRCSIINLRGISPQIQEIIVCKLLSDLFELRKQDKIPPFFSVLEEAHIFCPERSFGETKASKILRTIASEGRKFGLGLAIISQRPARVDKSVLSQCSTQIILKVTNPNDLKAISASVEGISSDSEKEIINLPIGSALVTGLVDVPLFVNVRPRRSKHGGEAIDMLGHSSEEDDFLNKVDDFDKREILPVIRPKLSLKEMQIIQGKEIDKVRTILVPGLYCSCGDTFEFSLIFDLHSCGIVHNDTIQKIPDLDILSADELTVLKKIFSLKRCTAFHLKGIVENLSLSLSKLLDLGYICELEGTYRLSQDYVFSRLDTRRTFQKVEYSSISYDELLTPKMDKEQVTDMISRFVLVNDLLECYIIKYDVTFKD